MTRAVAPPRHEDDGIGLRELVRSCCRQHGLLPDAVDDLVLEAEARIPPGLSLSEMVAAADEIARVEAERLGRRCSVEVEPGDGVPALLPAFARMAAIHPRPRSFRRAIGSVAIAVAETDLEAERFVLFFLAWVRGKPLDAILETLRQRGRPAGPRRTLQRRLRRVSDAIQSALVVRLALHMLCAERAWLGAATGAPRGTREHAPRPPGEASWTILAGAMDALTLGRPPRGGAADA